VSLLDFHAYINEMLSSRRKTPVKNLVHIYIYIYIYVKFPALLGALSLHIYVCIYIYIHMTLVRKWLNLLVHHVNSRLYKVNELVCSNELRGIS
jgi:hypothetical protein